LSPAAAAGFCSPPLSNEKAVDPALATSSPAVLTEASDETPLALIAAHDNEALGRLFRRYAKIVHGIGSRILHDKAEAEDLVQDVFLEIEDRGGTTPVASAVERDHSAEIIFGRSTWRGMLKALTADQWETLRMHFFEGYTLSEVAQKRGESVGNARHHFYRGLEALRKQVFSGDLSRRAKNNGK
jgi:RNA polymerase sigma-70 factor, ECF subfamily